MGSVKVASSNSCVNERYLRRLPLLDFTEKLFPTTSLKDVQILAAQHLVSTTYSLFHVLIKLGLNPKNLSVIGKCYSTDPEAVCEMQKLGIDVCSTSLSFDSYKPFDSVYRESIQNFALSRLSPDNKNLIILDDGGELIFIANKLCSQGNCAGVEQTTSGYNKLKDSSIGFPVVNLARSQAKLGYESPIIADLVSETLDRHINKLSVKPKTLLIIGYGAIGQAIALKLQHRYVVSIFDLDTSRSSIAENEFISSLKNFDIIIGCTGRTVITQEHFPYLKKGVILVSASSSDREFDATLLRCKVPQINNCHTDIEVDDIFLINCGFPINFSDEYKKIDCDRLQLTRALILAAVLQANENYSNHSKGLVDLDTKVQKQIVQKYFDLFDNIDTKNAKVGELAYGNSIL